jgi:disulfide oxidoreductase YuzD
MKTAVEWLEEQFKKVNHLTENEWIELFNQAKEIEKQQIIDASNSDKYLTSDFIDRAIDNGNSLGEQYYNETFNKDE